MSDQQLHLYGHLKLDRAHMDGLILSSSMGSCFSLPYLSKWYHRLTMWSTRRSGSLSWFFLLSSIPHSIQGQFLEGLCSKCVPYFTICDAKFDLSKVWPSQPSILASCLLPTRSSPASGPLHGLFLTSERSPRIFTWIPFSCHSHFEKSSLPPLT